MITQITLELHEQALRVVPRLPESIVMEAAKALGYFYAKTNNQRIAGMLASLVRDKSLSIESRTYCYFLMLGVANVSFDCYPINLAVFQLEHDARWDIVNQYEVGGETKVSGAKIMAQEPIMAVSGHFLCRMVR